MRRSITTDVAALNRAKLDIEAAIEDWPRLIRALHEAADHGYPTGGDGGPTGRGGHRDLSDRLRYTPDGGIAADPAEADLAELGRCVTALLRAATTMRGVQVKNLRDPASANWCCNAHGCPDGRKAEPGRGGRCEACYRAWHRSGKLEDRQTAGRTVAA